MSTSNFIIIQFCRLLGFLVARLTSTVLQVWQAISFRWQLFECCCCCIFFDNTNQLLLFVCQVAILVILLLSSFRGRKTESLATEFLITTLVLSYKCFTRSGSSPVVERKPTQGVVGLKPAAVSLIYLYRHSFFPLRLLNCVSLPPAPSTGSVWCNPLS